MHATYGKHAPLAIAMAAALLAATLTGFAVVAGYAAGLAY